LIFLSKSNMADTVNVHIVSTRTHKRTFINAMGSVERLAIIATITVVVSHSINSQSVYVGPDLG
jgi:hypothetical protein